MQSSQTREGYGKGERGPCLHCLRQTFAVKSFAKSGKEGLNARDAVPFLSTYLGHDSLQETEKYLKYSGDYFSDTVTMFDEFAGGLFPEVKFDAQKSSNFIPVLEDYFATYLAYSRGLSVNTINSYKQCFLLLLTFMQEKKGKDPDEVSFADLGYDTLQEFLRWLETERGCTAATRIQRLSAISSFSEYAQNRDFDAASLFRTAVNRVPSKKRRRSRGRFLQGTKFEFFFQSRMSVTKPG